MENANKCYITFLEWMNEQITRNGKLNPHKVWKQQNMVQTIYHQYSYNKHPPISKLQWHKSSKFVNVIKITSLALTWQARGGFISL